MMTDIKTAFRRTQATLLQDVIGAGALVVMLIAGLHLPGFM